jgi:hypothetical protein
MGFPWYAITGDIKLDIFTKLRTHERGFVWRGFTPDYEMKPTAANYDQNGKFFTDKRTGDCQPLAEIQRVAEKIYELNKLQKFPFEIPLSIRNILFPSFYKITERIFDALDNHFFPDNSLAQAMALVQHEFGGTSLLDFSANKYKALYFAIGEKNNYSNDSYIFGLNIPYFETHKDHFPKDVLDTCKKKFDILYPSYFMNDKIAHQEGVFLYQKFEIDKFCNIKGDAKYENIIEFFTNYADGIKTNTLFGKKTIDEFIEMTDNKEGERIFYVSLRVPAKEKPVLKEYLNTIGITDNYMMNTICSNK